MMEVEFEYTNWKGKTSKRKVLPLAIRWGSTEWHPESQWLLMAVDIDKDVRREFAIADIVGWKQG